MRSDPFAAQKRYASRNAEQRNLVRISVWVPREDRERALDFCAKLRKKQRKVEGV